MEPLPPSGGEKIRGGYKPEQALQYILAINLTVVLVYVHAYIHTYIHTYIRIYIYIYIYHSFSLFRALSHV